MGLEAHVEALHGLLYISHISACRNRRDVFPTSGLNTPVSNYASVPVINNLKSRLMLSCAIDLLYFLGHLSTSLDFKLLFAGTEA